MASATATLLDESAADPSSLITCIVVHYGDPAATRRCLDSLSELPAVVLVDQPPTRFGAHPVVTRRIQTDSNIGFAAACNRAVSTVTTPFVLLLNNDAVLDDGAAARLFAVAGSMPPDAGGACLKLLGLDGRTIQSVGGLLFTRDGIGFPRGFGEADRGQYDALAEEEVGVPSGACALYRTDAWRAAGGMREEFFCYCEDGDLGLRMIALGYRFVSAPQVVVRHELSSSSGAHSMFKAFHVERNHILTMVHSAPLATLACLPLWTIVRLGRLGLDAARGRGAGAGLASEAPPRELVRTVLRAWSDSARLLGAAWKLRRDLRRADRRAAERVRRFLRTRRASFADFARSRGE
ncbi:MAG TPA: glycosyltransferase family 2 protein [Candidatus Limnocylindrales bacterium]|nr:glycosyltransferase family 2 protein [Candidatus Limnocylindrales bacterium]